MAAGGATVRSLTAALTSVYPQSCTPASGDGLTLFSWVTHFQGAGFERTICGHRARIDIVDVSSCAPPRVHQRGQILLNLTWTWLTLDNEVVNSCDRVFRTYTRTRYANRYFEAWKEPVCQVCVPHCAVHKREKNMRLLRSITS